ncbi:phage tail protein [Nitrosococcus oceani]|uniref:phage tail protein n=1 Tax=Nitrosococcus oceani TaxID=1229 RepID=UPI0009DE6F93|nr:tail fiber protein [Nitrosococcus oceani]
MLSGVPIGTVCSFAGQVIPVSGTLNDIWKDSHCPTTTPVKTQTLDAPIVSIEAQGWMLCDGRWLTKEQYPELFAVLGYLYGQSTNNSGQSTFRLPDYRGLFLRGFDAGAGMDPDASERMGPTGAAKQNVVGSRQCDALQDHTHPYQITNPAGVSQTGQAAGTSQVTRKTGSPNDPARSATETRPRNIAVNYIIRYR